MFRTAAMVAAACVACASAHTFNFSAYTNNSGDTSGIDTSATVSADSSSFSVLIENNSALGFIGSFYIENGSALAGVDAGSVAIGNGAGVKFKLANGRWNGPGGTDWASDSFLEITKHGGAANGINSGESLLLTFSHDGSFDLNAFVNAVNDEEIRFAIHYQAWVGGESEKLLNTTVVVIPLPPAAWAGLGTLCLIAGVRTARRRGRR